MDGEKEANATTATASSFGVCLTRLLRSLHSVPSCFDMFHILIFFLCKYLSVFTLHASCGTVYCNRSCLFATGEQMGGVGLLP